MSPLGDGVKTLLSVLTISYHNIKTVFSSIIARIRISGYYFLTSYKLPEGALKLDKGGVIKNNEKTSRG